MYLNLKVLLIYDFPNLWPDFLKKIELGEGLVCILSFHSPRVFRGFQKRANVVLLVGALFFLHHLKSLRGWGNFSLISQDVLEIPDLFFFFRKPTQKGLGQKQVSHWAHPPRNWVIFGFYQRKKPQVHQPFVCEIWGGFGGFFVVIFSKKPRVSHTSNLDLGAAPCLNPKKYVLRDQRRWLENGPGWKLDVFPIWKMGDIPGIAVLVYHGGTSDFVRTLAKIINELIEMREVFLYAALLSHNPQPPKITKELIELR